MMGEVVEQLKRIATVLERIEKRLRGDDKHD